MASRLAQLDRVRHVVQVLLRHGLLGLVDQLGLGDRRLTGGHRQAEMPAARLGRRLALALDELGPTFVKLGQFLAAREDLFPAAAVRELAQLQDRPHPRRCRGGRQGAPPGHRGSHRR